MMQVQANQKVRVRLSTDTTLTEVDSRPVLFSARTGKFYGLNPTAAYLVETLLQADFDSTVLKALEKFNKADEATLRTDLWNLIRQMASAKLFEVELSEKA